MLEKVKACIIIPTYNNELTLADVIQKVLPFVDRVEQLIVVNDGSTDGTSAILSTFSDRITLVDIFPNNGKGNALKTGFRKAIELGFDYAVTLDSDGQHFPEDIPAMIEAVDIKEPCVIMGSRDMEKAGAPGKNSFGNKFSNFWFKVETGITLPDTQTGFRVYPLAPIKGMRFFSNKFEFEIEVIVRLAWKGVSFKAVNINVLYDMQNRVSHFRPFWDFFRISVLNTVLVAIALLFYHPFRFFSRKTIEAIKKEAVKPNETNMSKAISLGFGVFMGIFPIWGFQLLVAIPIAFLFRLNKVLVVAAAHISIPPMIPFIIFGSYQTGALFVEDVAKQKEVVYYSVESIKHNFTQYFIGGVVLSIFAFLVVSSVSYFLISKVRNRKPSLENA